MCTIFFWTEDAQESVSAHTTWFPYIRQYAVLFFSTLWILIFQLLCVKCLFSDIWPYRNSWLLTAVIFSIYNINDRQSSKIFLQKTCFVSPLYDVCGYFTKDLNVNKRRTSLRSRFVSSLFTTYVSVAN